MTSANPGGRRLGGRVWIEEKPRCCPICSHPWTDRIEAAVMSGMKDVDVEARFRLDPGTVAHHCQVCIPKKGFCVQAARQLHSKVGKVVAEIVKLYADLLEIDPAAKPDKANNVYCQILDAAQRF